MIKRLIKEFMREKAASCSKKTLIYYQENLDKWIEYLESIDITDVRQITKSIYIDYVLQLRQKNIKNTTIKTYCRAISVFTNWLFENEYIDILYTHKVKLPSPDPELVVPLSIQEVEILDSCLNDRNYIIVHLMLDCGLRMSEVIGLKKVDVLSKDKFIRITKSKGNKSRLVPVPDELLKYILKYTEQPVTAHQYLLSNEDGKRLTVYSVKKLFVNLKKVPGLNRIHAHLLRHTFATSFIFGGGDVSMLRVLLGHADITITQNYLHLSNQMQVINYQIYRLDDVFFKNYRKED